jgi:hypothetical protein
VTRSTTGPPSRRVGTLLDGSGGLRSGRLVAAAGTRGLVVILAGLVLADEEDAWPHALTSKLHADSTVNVASPANGEMRAITEATHCDRGSIVQAFVPRPSSSHTQPLPEGAPCAVLLII